MERDYPLDRVRNFGIIAHIDAGKTTTSERILYYTGESHKIGEVHEGETVTDWMEQERERGITITAAAITCFWTKTDVDATNKANKHRFNIIDTPGHIDFTAEVKRSMRVLDGAIVVFDGVAGVEPQSETNWRYADEASVPRVCFINKLDRTGADFERSYATILDRLSKKAVRMQMPIGAEENYNGIIDLLTMKEMTFTGEMGKEVGTIEIPAEFLEEAKKRRAEMIERIVETDEDLMTQYLEGKEFSIEVLKEAVRKATLANELFPVFCGSALKNKGVQLVLDAVIDYLPSPVDLKEVHGLNAKTEVDEVRQLTPEESFSGFAFKVQVDPHVGKITYVRIYSGKLISGSYAYNSTKDVKERVGRLLLMHANQREEIKEAFAGEIVAVVGFKDTITGDTLCDESKPIILEKITFPEPVISLAIEPKTKSDQEKLGMALKRLMEEDPTFGVKMDHETGQTIISGVGELQLEIMVERMKREMGVDANVGAPQVAYKETIKGKADAEYKYIKQTGGRGQYGHVLITVEAMPRGDGFEFVNAIKGGAIPNEFIPSVEKGVREAMERGVMFGYTMVDVKVTLYDGTYHDVDSSDIAFKIAASQAFQAGTKKAEVTLLEPIMKVEVTTPEEFMGDIIGDLSSKRAQILGTEERGNSRIVLAQVPLAELSGYATTLRSMSQGRAIPYMEPSHYEEVPKNIQEGILAKSTFNARVE